MGYKYEYTEESHPWVEFADHAQRSKDKDRLRENLLPFSKNTRIGQLESLDREKVVDFVNFESPYGTTDRSV